MSNDIRRYYFCSENGLMDENNQSFWVDESTARWLKVAVIITIVISVAYAALR
jgi:hypothetical protein